MGTVKVLEASISGDTMKVELELELAKGSAIPVECKLDTLVSQIEFSGEMTKLLYSLYKAGFKVAPEMASKIKETLGGVGLV